MLFPEVQLCFKDKISTIIMFKVFSKTIYIFLFAFLNKKVWTSQHQNSQSNWISKNFNKLKLETKKEKLWSYEKLQIKL